MNLSTTRSVNGYRIIVWNSENRLRRLDIKFCWEKPGFSKYIGQLLRIKVWSLSLGFVRVGYYNAN